MICFFFGFFYSPSFIPQSICFSPSAFSFDFSIPNGSFLGFPTFSVSYSGPLTLCASSLGLSLLGVLLALPCPVFLQPALLCLVFLRPALLPLVFLPPRLLLLLAFLLLCFVLLFFLFLTTLELVVLTTKMSMVISTLLLLSPPF